MNNAQEAEIAEAEALVKQTQEKFESAQNEFLSAMKSQITRREGSGRQEALYDKYLSDLRKKEYDAENVFKNARQKLDGPKTSEE